MCVSVYCPLECAVCLSVCLCVMSSQSTSKKPQYVPSLSKLDAFLHKTHFKVLLVLRYQGSACVVPFLLLSKIAHQMWRNHPFSQTGQLCKETLKISHPLILTPAPPLPHPLSHSCPDFPLFLLKIYHPRRHYRHFWKISEGGGDSDYDTKAKIYLFKANNRDSLMLIHWFINIHWCCSGVFIVNAEHISHLLLVFLLFTLNK